MRAVLVLLFACGAKPGAPANVGQVELRLPGACVDPTADASKRLAGAGEGDPPTATAAPDLDGDGVADVAFPFGLGVTTHTLLYVKRGSCGHFVGDVGGPPLEGITAKANGLLEVKVLDVSSCEGARCGCEPGEAWFAFDGTAYRPDKARAKPSVEKPCAD